MRNSVGRSTVLEDFSFLEWNIINIVSENVVSENIVSENVVSENIVSENGVSEKLVSVDNGQFLR